jgi:hypothetical protein
MIKLQLHFALSTSTFWTIKDNNFDYDLFYHSIVDWFEVPGSDAMVQQNELLLRWWNR